MIIVGLDISSVALDACILEDDAAPRLRRETLGKSKDPLIQRLRCVPEALMHLQAFLPDIDWLVIEDSFGPYRNAVRTLDKVTGAIIASCPPQTQIATLSTGDWRKAIGADKNTKAAGHAEVLVHLFGNPRAATAYNEHELDAIGIALAWRKILEGQAER